MPDWCTNSLDVEGDADDVARFFAHAAGVHADIVDRLLAGIACEGTGQDTRDIIAGTVAGFYTRHFSFNYMYPTPSELENMDAPFRGEDEERERLTAKYGAADWYDWQVKNWGVKWGECDVDVELHEPRLAVITFDTPWGPPLVWLARAAVDHPKLTFRLAWETPEHRGVVHSDDLLRVGPAT